LVFQQRNGNSILQGIVNKAATKYESWKVHCLSKVGRTVLIQSHLETLPAHTMQCFQLPKATATQLGRIDREFLWKENNTKKGLNLIGWNTICMPKAKGGLGLRKAEAIN